MMQFDEFVGQVQHRARLPSSGDALKAIRVTLETLAERLSGEEPRNLASQLPQEIGIFLGEKGKAERFSSDEFFQRVAKRENSDLPDAVQHVRAVFSVINDAASKGEVDDLRSQLPEDYDALFESGSEGKLR
jgi:uncharacterized protein (DUF2267 family)